MIIFLQITEVLQVAQLVTLSCSLKDVVRVLARVAQDIPQYVQNETSWEKRMGQERLSERELTNVIDSVVDEFLALKGRQIKL